MGAARVPEQWLLLVCATMPHVWWSPMAILGVLAAVGQVNLDDADAVALWYHHLARLVRAGTVRTRFTGDGPSYKVAYHLTATGRDQARALRQERVDGLRRRVSPRVWRRLVAAANDARVREEIQW